MYERIKCIRKKAGLTQAVFGKEMGVSRDVIANIENNRVVPSETFIQLFCSKHAVSEEWLRNGTGEMFERTQTDELSELRKKHDLDTLDLKIISEYMQLSKEQRSTLKHYLKNVFSNIKIDKEENGQTSQASPHGDLKESS